MASSKRSQHSPEGQHLISKSVGGSNCDPKDDAKCESENQMKAPQKRMFQKAISALGKDAKRRKTEELLAENFGVDSFTMLRKLFQHLEEASNPVMSGEATRLWLLESFPTPTLKMKDELAAIFSDSNRRKQLYTDMKEHQRRFHLHPLSNSLTLLDFLECHAELGMNGTQLLMAIHEFEKDASVLNMPLLQCFKKDLKARQEARTKSLEELAAGLHFVGHQIELLKSKK